MEAMALGRPVVAAAVDGVPELVVHGETGILVPPGDPEALARALDLLASDTDLATGLGEAGRIRVGMFDLDGMVDAHLAAYRGAMAGRRRGRAGPVAA
jgi:glycosyltransferase involved in cell wall biosynthesis